MPEFTVHNATLGARRLVQVVAVIQGKQGGSDE